MTKTISYALALALGCVLIACIDANPITKRAADVATEFIILHNNDMHARFEQTSVDSTKCTPELANTDKCYGGFARVAFEVRKFRDEAQKGGQAVLYLNAGDTYTGTPWFTVYKDNITSAFMNKLMPDAISLGNHEFDDGVEGLVPFLKEVKFPVLAANLDLSQTPELQNEPNLRPSAILDVRGTKVGVVGYLTPETKNLTKPSSVIFQEEIKAINAEAAKLKSQGVHIIIALGHSGYQEDQNIAKGCLDVDIVIGGHTNTFLYNGEQPDAERIDGPYPTVIKQSSGKSVPVVQAYAYTKYLGRLHVQFDKDGNLLEFDGTPILLNASVHREDDVLQLLEVYRPKIDELENDIVGHTKVHLEGRAEVCRVEECNLGNLITDAMIYARAIEDMGGAYWTDAPIAFLGGGGIRNSIMKASDGAITGNDILGVLPFDNDLVVTKISGKTVRGALEHSAYLRSQDSNGGFLQMSGVYVTYDFNKPEGQRAVSVEVRCAECDVPSYSPLDDTKMYNVIVPSFCYNGGDGHVFKEPGTPEDFVPTRLQKNDSEALRQYLKQRDFVYPELEERIKIIEAPKGDSAAGLASSIFAITCALILRSIL